MQSKIVCGLGEARSYIRGSERRSSESGSAQAEMIDLDWLTDQLCDVLRWQMAHPGRTDGPEIPWAGRRVWGLFVELNATRTPGMSTNPISYLEIESWSRMRREPVRPFELDMLRTLDAAYLKPAEVVQEAKPAPSFKAIAAVLRSAATDPRG